MFDLINAVVPVLVSLLAGGAGGIAQGALEHGGARTVDAVSRALAERNGEAPGSPGPAEVEQAVRDALAAGTLTEQDLLVLVERPPKAMRVHASKGGVAFGNVYGNVSFGQDVRRTERSNE